MTPFIKYLADDGSEHRTADAAIAHERLCANVAEIMALLPALPDDPRCKFANGNGYIQHDAQNVQRVRNALLGLANQLKPHDWLQKSMADPAIHASWAGRLLDEEYPRPLSRAWYRFHCIDSEWREWGQPYYANNTPTDAKQLHQINA